MSSLQHRYSRLLRWYPADHRRVHEDEMLGVLLASAQPGQERPTPRERLDLVGGALAIRLRRALSSAADGWSDALAVTGVLAALLLAAQTVAGLAVGLGLWGVAVSDGFAYGYTVIAVATALCAVRGARRGAVVCASLYATGTVVDLILNARVDALLPLPNIILANLLLPVLFAGLLLGEGPRRGMELIRTRRALVLGLVLTGTLFVDQDPGMSWNTGLGVEGLTVFAVLAGLAMARPTGRRAALLLALPGALSLRSMQPMVSEGDGALSGVLTEPPTTIDLFAGGFFVTQLIPVLAFAIALWAAARRRPGTPEEQSQPPVPA
ncbi:MAG TPA: hypothetical protein VHJ17_01645 [Thermomonospora sp.]|nr:hypothetical protein [Thermomonospora sp.]